MLSISYKLIKLVALCVMLMTLLFPLTAWLGSSIPRDSLAEAAKPVEGIEIMLETNGTHTGIIVPVVTAEKDWREVFPSASQLRGGQAITHLSIGWGEREVFMEIPTWGDLTASTATRIAVFGGEPVMRVSHYVRPRPSENYRPIVISREAYARMAAAIEASLAPPLADGTRERLIGVNPEDAYYEAVGHYTLANTCNSWVGDMLAQADVPMGYWTPFAGGVTKWVEPPAEAI